jgi:vacuolar-type H+-ATPase subunit E/Vma4
LKLSERELRERFGNLGIYLVEKAQKQVKEMNQQTLFQKAEIKKTYRERTQEQANKKRAKFIDDYKEKLNTSLSATLLWSKEKLLNLKNDLVKKTKVLLIDSVKKSMEENYEDYINYLDQALSRVSEKVNKTLELTLIFNNKDYEYFKNNKTDLKKHFKNSIDLVKSKKQIIGGFILNVEEQQISYDNSLDSLIEEKYSFLEKNLTNLISESKIKEIENEYKKFIENKKSNIENELRRYERI